MRIEQTFWYREKHGTKQLFSYSNDNMAHQFAEKYGGEVYSFLDVSDDIASILDDCTQLCSVIVQEHTQKKADSLASDKRRFYVLVLQNGVFQPYGEPHQFVKQANDVAKNVCRFYEKTIVIRKFYRGEEDESNGIAI